MGYLLRYIGSITVAPTICLPGSLSSTLDSDSREPNPGAFGSIRSQDKRTDGLPSQVHWSTHGCPNNMSTRVVIILSWFRFRETSSSCLWSSSFAGLVDWGDACCGTSVYLHLLQQSVCLSLYHLHLIQIQGNIILVSLVQFVRGTSGPIGCLLRYMGHLTVAPNICLSESLSSFLDWFWGTFSRCPWSNSFSGLADWWAVCSGTSVHSALPPTIRLPESISFPLDTDSRESYTGVLDPICSRDQRINLRYIGPLTAAPTICLPDPSSISFSTDLDSREPHHRVFGGVSSRDQRANWLPTAVHRSIHCCHNHLPALAYTIFSWFRFKETSSSCPWSNSFSGLADWWAACSGTSVH